MNPNEHEATKNNIKKERESSETIQDILISDHSRFIFKSSRISDSATPYFCFLTTDYSARKVKRLNSVTAKVALSAFNTSATVCFGSMMLS